MSGRIESGPRPRTLIEELLALQAERGFLHDDDLRALALRTRAPLYEIEGLISFYPHFRRTPPASFEVRACRDLACQMRGGDQAGARLQERCRDDAQKQFEWVSCLGRCDDAPACLIDDVPLPAEAALAALEAGGAPPVVEERASPKRQWKLDPYASAAEHYGALRGVLAEPAGPARSRGLIERVSRSDLRGMGGAGFPTGRKWELVAEQPATPRFVICNADESEPGTFKDRAVLSELPHLMIEGIVLAGLAIGSHEGWIYIRHEYDPEREILEAALADARARGALGRGIFGSDFDFELHVFVSPGGYVLGEETALLEALEGRRGEPRNKPPFPGVRGLFGQPTLINNVESFAQIPHVLETGRADLKLFSVSGDVERPGVVEAPLGTPLSTLIETCGGMLGGRELMAFLPGGASTGFLGPEHRDIAMDWGTLADAGSSLGSAAVLVVAEGRDLIALAENLVRFFRNESCGKCVPCRIGTQKAVKLIGAGDRESMSLLPELHETLRLTSICGLGQVALEPILSALRVTRARESDATGTT